MQSTGGGQAHVGRNGDDVSVQVDEQKGKIEKRTYAEVAKGDEVVEE